MRVAGKDAGLDIELAETTPHAENYAEVNPLGKIPAFVGANGFTLTESVAIAVFRMFFFILFLLFCKFLLFAFIARMVVATSRGWPIIMMSYIITNSYPCQNIRVDHLYSDTCAIAFLICLMS